jgi:hypothetical protein
MFSVMNSEVGKRAILIIEGNFPVITSKLLRSAATRPNRKESRSIFSCTMFRLLTNPAAPFLRVWPLTASVYLPLECAHPIL